MEHWVLVTICNNHVYTNFLLRNKATKELPIKVADQYNHKSLRVLESKAGAKDLPGFIDAPDINVKRKCPVMRYWDNLHTIWTGLTYISSKPHRIQTIIPPIRIVGNSTLFPQSPLLYYLLMLLDSVLMLLDSVFSTSD